jgi:hypothetical protein
MSSQSYITIYPFKIFSVLLSAANFVQGSEEESWSKLIKGHLEQRYINVC